MSVSVVTGKVRLSYVFVKQPGKLDGKYSVTAIIPKDDDKTLPKIKKAIKDCVDEGVSSKWGGKKPSNLWNPLRDGDEVADEHPEYAGCYYIKCKSSEQPGVIDRQKNEIFDLDDLYSGCYARLDLSLFPYANNSNGIGVGLNNIQMIAEGERLGGGAGRGGAVHHGVRAGQHRRDHRTGG